jgi:hypothetical protein
MAARQIVYFEDVAATRRFPHFKGQTAKAGRGNDFARPKRAAQKFDRLIKNQNVLAFQKNSQRQAS